jgi:hypothetical protein
MQLLIEVMRKTRQGLMSTSLMSGWSKSKQSKTTVSH